jgi:hypothetical protein
MLINLENKKMYTRISDNFFNNILSTGSGGMNGNDNEAAKRGLLLGVGLGAGLALRGGIFRTLFTGAALVPTLAAIGVFASVELHRRHGHKKSDELIKFGIDKSVDARDFVQDKINSFCK